jgi:hypothetical protein
MFRAPLLLWLPRWLWRSSLALSILMVVLVVAAPLIDYGEFPIVTLLARDVTARRTCLAGALGLLATAAIFFRPQDYRVPGERDRRRSLRSPQTGAGA